MTVDEVSRSCDGNFDDESSVVTLEIKEPYSDGTGAEDVFGVDEGENESN